MSSTDEPRSPRIWGRCKQAPNCCVPGCKSFKQKDTLLLAGVKLSHHRIPIHDKKRTKLWLDLIGRDAWIPNSSSRICSIHFEGGKKSDNPKEPGYIPTIFPSRQKAIKRRTTMTSSKAKTTSAKRVCRKILSDSSSHSCDTLPLSPPSITSENKLSSSSVSQQVDSVPALGEEPQVISSRLDHDYVYPFNNEVERLKLQLQEVQRENEILKNALSLHRKKDNDAKFHYMTYLPNSDTFEVQTVST